MFRLFETIRIESGMLMHPEEHEERMLRSCSALFGSKPLLLLRDVINVPQEYSTGKVRCRVGYGPEVVSVTFSAYRMKPMQRFQMVVNDDIEYPYKFSDRSAIEMLLQEKKDADEIVIVKNGRVTDTSISNLIFYDGKRWITPSTPLLKGTCRARLLKEGKITEREITPGEIRSFSGFKLINAMIFPDETDLIPMEAIRFP